jgi:hypothetical protein
MLRTVRRRPERSPEYAPKIKAGRPQAPVRAAALGLAEGDIR